MSPIYQYQCAKCLNEVELLMGFESISSPMPCIKCGYSDMEKKVSRSAFFLSGGGWARDSYGKGNQLLRGANGDYDKPK